MPYEITVQDIQNYVATVPEDEPVGIPEHRYKCLVAQTLMWKYPGVEVAVWFDNSFAQIEGQRVDLPDDVQAAAYRFDDLYDEAPVTPVVLSEHMPELLAGR